VVELTSRFGADKSQWRLGHEKLHHALIHHPLSAAVSADVRKQLDVGPVPRGGDSHTVSATGGGDNQVSGGSLKMIADVSNWDNSIAMNNPGQSGDPRSPHYRDLFELWSRNRYFPLFYSREKVESVTGQRLQLQPASAPAATK
jgi:penicillin amidase